MRKIAFAVIGSTLSAFPLSAQTIYQCISPDGSTIFSDSPCGKDAKSVTAAAANSNFDVTFDRFDGVTKYSSRHSVSAINKLAVQTVVNVSPTVFTAQFLILGGFPGGWKYLNCHYSSWIVGADRIELSQATHIGQVAPRVGVIDGISQSLTKDQFFALAASSRIQYKICNDEFEFSPTELSELKSIARRVGKDYPYLVNTTGGK